MDGQVFHFSVELIDLLTQTIPRLCKSKTDVIVFFSSAGVSQKFLADIRRRVEQDRNNISKYQIVRDVIIRLNEAGDAALRERREIIKRVVDFKDFSGCWPDDQIPARGFVARVRESINHTDSDTRQKQYHESQREEERKKRQQDEEARIKQLKLKKQKREQLKSELIGLYQETNAQKRGKQLEAILNSLFESEGILVRESFTIKGENNEGVIQQVDGAIEVNSCLYLIEMKWCKEALGPGDVTPHMMRLFARTDVRGIFISASGYTEAAIIDIKAALNQKIIVLFTLKELVFLLERESPFESLLKSKVEAIQLERKLLYDL
ncbi:restriction endonuclease [Microcoleus sp. herbarium19]|uniref:restriction endonuclease n=1 Tax=unclassified Microcoleus TaxID=2642155 RepID=UPI002FD78DCE